MHAVILDTYPIIKAFKAVGFSDQQAEAQAEVARIIFNATAEQIKEITQHQQAVTLQDVKQIETDLVLQIQKMAAETELEKEKIHSSLELSIEKLRAELMDKLHAMDSKLERFRGELGKDIEKSRGELGNDIEKYRGELGKEIEKSKNSVLLWMFGMLAAQTTLIFGFFGKALDLF